MELERWFWSHLIGLIVTHQNHIFKSIVYPKNLSFIPKIYPFSQIFSKSHCIGENIVYPFDFIVYLSTFIPISIGCITRDVLLKCTWCCLSIGIVRPKAGLSIWKVVVEGSSFRFPFPKRRWIQRQSKRESSKCLNHNELSDKCN